MPDESDNSDHQRFAARALIETAAILALFFVMAGDPPPGVNEAHYLAKAKHYWDPAWCGGDQFLESADAHLVFYWTFGWLTLLLPLPLVAWVGRLVVWVLLAVSLRRLTALLVPGVLRSVLVVGLFACLSTWGHLSGEWVIGGFEAKGVAYALVFFGLEALVRGRWNLTWLLLGASAAFHVLVGGWSVVAALLAWLVCGTDRPRFVRMLPSLCGGLLLALPGLLPVLALNAGVDRETTRQANEIYVHQRLDHHLLFHEILRQRPVIDLTHLGLGRWRWLTTHSYFVRHMLVFALWATLAWRVRPDGGSWRFHAFVAGSAGIAAAGMVIDQATLYAPDLAASLLRYYWLRLADVILPLGAAVAVGQAIGRLAVSHARRADAWAIGVLVVVALFVVDSYLRHRTDPRPAAVRQSGGGVAAEKRYDDWVAACRWLNLHTARDEVVLTPRHQQTFKWYAQRPEVVNWKDVPQDAAGIIEWWRRKQEIYPREVERAGLAAHGEQRLRELAAEYGFRYVLVERRPDSPPLNFIRVFPQGSSSAHHYEIYVITPPSTTSQD